ncbi:MAG: NAD(P)H-hydrate epimerase [Planctomycetia bacterium]|nr:NAD(P)H-hydrate epimerase [Planctomycetia bacterium]
MQTKWLYDEFKSSGVSYEATSTAAAFDSRHEHFRDYTAEFAQICERTGLNSASATLDVGCGSGAFVLPASKLCRRVTGVDISEAMLSVLRSKASSKELERIELQHAGFLTFESTPESYDVVVSSLALHHLPDFWKGVALERIWTCLRQGGVFYLVDVVFDFPAHLWREGVETLLENMVSAAGTEGYKHVQSEYSAYDWAMRELLERAGFTIESTYRDLSFTHTYVCRKSLACRSAGPKGQRLLTSCQKIREVDAALSSRWGMPTLLLMENAARSLADQFHAHARELNGGLEPRRVLLCCGKGNNAGDGFAMFRRLEYLGYDCRVLAFAPPESYRADAKTNLEIVRRATGGQASKLIFCTDPLEIRASLESGLQWCDWSVDALLGTGGKGALRSPYNEIVTLMNASGKPIYSVDIPSGLNGDTGEVDGVAIRARMTTTLGAYKEGLLQRVAQAYVGALFLGDIGAPLGEFLA